MDIRTKHTYNTKVYDLVRDVAVQCPQCSAKAVVKSGNLHALQYDVEGVRVVCAACGYSKTLEKISIRSKHLKFGAPVDPFFHLPVWYQVEFEGNTLWGYNLEHLEFLQQHVAAKLRERNGQPNVNRSVGSRLPRWMTEKHNREAVIKALEQLKKR